MIVVVIGVLFSCCIYTYVTCIQSERMKRVKHSLVCIPFCQRREVETNGRFILICLSANLSRLKSLADVLFAVPLRVLGRIVFPVNAISKVLSSIIYVKAKKYEV